MTIAMTSDKTSTWAVPRCLPCRMRKVSMCVKGTRREANAPQVLPAIRTHALADPKLGGGGDGIVRTSLVPQFQVVRSKSSESGGISKMYQERWLPDSEVVYLGAGKHLQGLHTSKTSGGPLSFRHKMGCCLPEHLTPIYYPYSPLFPRAEFESHTHLLPLFSTLSQSLT